MPPKLVTTDPTQLLWAHQMKREHGHLLQRVQALEAAQQRSEDLRSGNDSYTNGRLSQLEEQFNRLTTTVEHSETQRADILTRVEHLATHVEVVVTRVDDLDGRRETGRVEGSRERDAVVEEVRERVEVIERSVGVCGEGVKEVGRRLREEQDGVEDVRGRVEWLVRHVKDGEEGMERTRETVRELESLVEEVRTVMEGLLRTAAPAFLGPKKNISDLSMKAPVSASSKEAQFINHANEEENPARPSMTSVTKEKDTGTVPHRLNSVEPQVTHTGKRPYQMIDRPSTREDCGSRVPRQRPSQSSTPHNATAEASSSRAAQYFKVPLHQTSNDSIKHIAKVAQHTKPISTRRTIHQDEDTPAQPSLQPVPPPPPPPINKKRKADAVVDDTIDIYAPRMTRSQKVLLTGAAPIKPDPAARSKAKQVKKEPRARAPPRPKKKAPPIKRDGDRGAEGDIFPTLRSSPPPMFSPDHAHSIVEAGPAEKVVKPVVVKKPAARKRRVIPQLDDDVSPLKL